ncbi:MAG: tyrosine-type recombinase/integrase [Moraxellaceae bacterium]|nr:tyrosine-type recombinase/integrase [Moraxellaceae bacterium]
MRPKTSGRDLPPRMLRRSKKLKNGKEWFSYYYNGRDDDGRRVEIPLGSDISEAKKRWAEFEMQSTPQNSKQLNVIFDRYIKEILPLKMPRTQKDNLDCFKFLRPVFGEMLLEDLVPQHFALYRDKRSAKVRANRELSLLSHVFNCAREWGYTCRDNPSRGVRKNKESPRDFYVDDAVWEAVYEFAVNELKDAMDLAYLTGQRPADILKISVRDIQEDILYVQQGKTNKKLRILLKNSDGSMSQLAQVLNRIRTQPRKVSSIFLVATPSGVPLNKNMLRTRFDSARILAAANAEKIGTEEMLDLAKRIKSFQFRDIRPKAASDMGDLAAASRLLGHTEQQITKKVYIRVGEVVRPTK